MIRNIIRDRIIEGGGIGHIRMEELNEAIKPIWHTMDKLPIPPADPDRLYKSWSFLIQTEGGYVTAAEAYYGRNGRSPKLVVRWRSGNRQIIPKYWTHLPEPRKD